MLEYTLDAMLIRELCGPADKNIHYLEEKLKADIIVRGNQLKVKVAPEDEPLIKQCLEQIFQLLKIGESLSPRRLRYIIQQCEINQTDEQENISRYFKDKVVIAGSKRRITPRTKNQHQYIKAMKDHPLVLAIGPAGTGKTYLAIAVAIDFLMSKKVERIILVRPAVEAGEKLGFLPGDLVQKVNPYLRPLYDALYDILTPQQTEDFIDRGLIEVAPIAFMRGRTLNRSFIILDEGQNTTIDQMKMFLTRMGNDSRVVATGDITQIDLPSKQQSGLIHAERILSSIKNVKVVTFSQIDVVRHELVQQIIEAYESNESRNS